MSLAEIAAVIVVLFTKVLARTDPFQDTIAPLMKPEPLTIRVKPAPPARLAGRSKQRELQCFQ
jgi:hypothetical protein